MHLPLFSEISVRDYFDSAVTQQAERRVFNVSDDHLQTQPATQLIDGILIILSPGRLVVDADVSEEIRTDTLERMRIRRWLEFSGNARLLSLRPRQYYAAPPSVHLLQPPAAGQAGRIVFEMTVRTLEDKAAFDRYCDAEFAKVREYVHWVNDDLDHYEQGAREWLLTLIEARLARLRRTPTRPDASAPPESDDHSTEAAGRDERHGTLPFANLSSN